MKETIQQKIDKVKTFKNPVIYINSKDKELFHGINMPIKTSDFIDVGSFTIIDEADSLFFKLDVLDKWIDIL